MWVSLEVEHFPIHQKKPCQVDWQKLVLPVKIYLVEEKFSFLIKHLILHMDNLYELLNHIIPINLSFLLFKHLKFHIFVSFQDHHHRAHCIIIFY